MIKKIIFSISLLLIPIITLASDNKAFGIGNHFYDTLEDAILNANSTDTIALYSNATLNNTITIDKVINIDLNGYDISSPSTSFLVKGGTLNIRGKGTIKETEPNYGVIRVMGSTTNTNELYSVVKIDKDVTLEGWAGIFITHTSNKSHGILVNLDGNINAVTDVNGDEGAGIYINGSIKHEDSHPVINITENANITSNGTGLFIAGYATININKAYIKGKQSGIGIKAGKLNITYATIICDGEDKTPTEGYNNGIKSSGTTIQIESNNGYAGNIELNIESGNMTSKNSNVIYEYIGKGNTTEVKSISISGGTFKSEAGKDVFLLSNSFKETHPSFISGGKYSSNPTSYLKSNYTADLEDNMYIVSKSTIAVFGETFNNENNNFNSVFIIILILLISIIMFIYRLKILNFIKKIWAK